MPDEPGLLARVVAHLHGEVAATALEAYRRGGAAVWDLEPQLEQRRLEAVVAGADAWTLPAATAAALLCGWNAAVLQLLGDELLDADEATAGTGAAYVEPETSEQTLAFYGQVAGWLSRAQQALHNPEYELDVTVPAVLPLVASTPCSREHLVGLLAGMARLRTRTDGLLADLPHGEGEAARARHRIEQLKAEADSAADYAGPFGAASGACSPSSMVLGSGARPLRLALNTFLPRHPGRRLRRVGGRRMYAAAGRSQRRRRSVRMAALERVSVRRVAGFAGVPGARSCSAERSEASEAEGIDAALFRDDVAHDVGHFDRCPWSPIYLAKRPVTIGAKQLHPLQQFTYEVMIQYVGNKRRFVRQIVKGPFARSRERF